MKTSLFALLTLGFAIMPMNVYASNNLLEGAISSNPAEYNSVDDFYKKWIVCDMDGNPFADQTSYISEFTTIAQNWTIKYNNTQYQPFGSYNDYIGIGTPMAVFQFGFSATEVAPNYINYNFPITVPEDGEYILTGGMVTLTQQTNVFKAKDSAIPNMGFFVFVASDRLDRKVMSLVPKENNDGYNLVVTDSEGKECNMAYVGVPRWSGNTGSSSCFGQFEQPIYLTTDTKYFTVYGPDWLPGLASLSLIKKGSDDTGGVDILNDEPISETKYFDLQGRQLLNPMGICIQVKDGKSKLLIK